MVAVPTSWPRKLPFQSSPLRDHLPSPSVSFSSREGLTSPSILSTTPSAACDPGPGTPAALWGTRAHKAAEVGGRASQRRAPSASLPADWTAGRHRTLRLLSRAARAALHLLSRGNWTCLWGPTRAFSGSAGYRIIVLTGCTRFVC